MKKNKNKFTLIAAKCSDVVGSPWTFIGALAVVLIWTFSGSIFHYSDTWQLVMNTTSSVVTFLIVFLIQNTQNRDTLMIKIKLDELIESSHMAKNSAIDLSLLSDKQLKELEEKYLKKSKQPPVA